MAGARLLARRFVPLVIVVLAPVMVQIFLLRLILTRGVANLAAPRVIVVLEARLGFVVYRSSYRSVLAATPA